MKLTQNTFSNALTLDEVLTRLAASDIVDGLALFGSRTTDFSHPVSDTDLLILVTHQPVSIFQMLTHIDGRMADVVFVETETADRLLATPNPASAASVEGMFLLKMQTAQIRYDASARLGRIRQLVERDRPSGDWLLPSTYQARYGAWFWQNHGLYHLKRMAQSEEATYLTAVDMLLLACLSQICRDYSCVRNLPWQGEKAAIRYLQENDPDYLALLRECLAASDRGRKLALYEQLVTHTLAPVGPVWTPGITAVYLSPPTQDATHLETALAFWESLLTDSSPPRSASLQETSRSG